MEMDVPQCNGGTGMDSPTRNAVEGWPQKQLLIMNC